MSEPTRIDGAAEHFERLLKAPGCGHPNDKKPSAADVREVPAKWSGKPRGRLVGVVDEYGTVWDAEPGASRIIGDLVVRQDEETSWLYLKEGEPLSKWDRLFALLRGEL